LTDQEILDFVKEKGLAKFKWPKNGLRGYPRNPAGKIEKPKLRDIYVKPAKEAWRRSSKSNKDVTGYRLEETQERYRAPVLSGTGAPALVRPAGRMHLEVQVLYGP